MMLLAAIPRPDPSWATPLLIALPPAAIAVCLDRVVLAIASRSRRGVRGGRASRLAIGRPWPTVVVGNIAGWLTVLLLMPLLWSAVSEAPAAITAHPIKQWYLHLRLRGLEDVAWVVGAAVLPAVAMHVTTWAASRRRRPPAMWLLGAFAGTELMAMVAAGLVALPLG